MKKLNEKDIRDSAVPVKGLFGVSKQTLIDLGSVVNSYSSEEEFLQYIKNQEAVTRQNRKRRREAENKINEIVGRLGDLFETLLPFFVDDCIICDKAFARYIPTGNLCDSCQKEEDEN